MIGCPELFMLFSCIGDVWGRRGRCGEVRGCHFCLGSRRSNTLISLIHFFFFLVCCCCCALFSVSVSFYFFLLVTFYLFFRTKRMSRNFFRLDLLSGVEMTELRGELYVHAMKQLTKNSTPASVQRCWEVVTMLLTCFPPPKVRRRSLARLLVASLVVVRIVSC